MVLLHKLYFLLPCLYHFCAGLELFDYVVDNAPLTDDVARHIFRQMNEGARFLHSIGVVHRDISCENFMITNNGLNIKYIDFGMALLLPQDENGVTLSIQPQGTCGKGNYMRFVSYVTINL